jgi:hypothetical protein
MRVGTSLASHSFDVSAVIAGVLLYSPLAVPILGLVHLARGRHALEVLSLCACFWAWWAVRLLVERDRTTPDWQFTELTATLLLGLSASALAFGLASFMDQRRIEDGRRRMSNAA